MTTIYVEPFSGLSGDMLLSAFCGLADYYDEIIKLPQKLHLNDAQVVVKEVNKNGIVCKHVKIIDLNEDKGHHHEHEHEQHHHHHDHKHHHHHDHAHDHHGEPEHHHHHEHEHQHHHNAHRHLKDILAIIDQGHISDQAKFIAKAIFTIIGKSEAKIHKMDLDTIHFHEVSGVDSILDIVGCAVLIDHLNITKTFSDPICTGYGMVNTQHGLLPIPAPATADLLQNMPVYKGNEEGERVTPTGAAVLKFLKPDFNIQEIALERIAYGPGTKEFVSPNVVRVSVLAEREERPEAYHDQVILVETNIDDSSAELLGQDFQDDLIRHGALDFYFTSIQMKKSRPGLMLTVLVAPNHLDSINSLILEHSSSIGLRYYPVVRDILPRKQYELHTPYGEVQIKEVVTPSGSKRLKIEYESLLEIKKKHNIPILRLQNELYALLSKNQDHEEE